MNDSSSSSIVSTVRQKPVLWVIGLIVLVALGWLVLRPSSAPTVATAYHEVRRGDFTVSVVEGGTLSAVSEVSIRNEVEGTARIISIVPEGSYVKKGDLLVELDSAQAQDQVNLQQINFEKAKFAVEQARAPAGNPAQRDQQRFPGGGTQAQVRQDRPGQIRAGPALVDLVEASNKVVQAEAQLVGQSRHLRQFHQPGRQEATRPNRRWTATAWPCSTCATR